VYCSRLAALAVLVASHSCCGSSSMVNALPKWKVGALEGLIHVQQHTHCITMLHAALRALFKSQ
jgi:hypothetical protein